MEQETQELRRLYVKDPAFRGVGLGLGGTIGPTLYLPLGVAIYLAQLVASRAWLGRFQYGPLEWLWRMLTYGTAIPLRKRAVVAAER